MALDIEQLLEPVSEDAPSGESIEYDASYIELETLSKGVELEKDAAGRVVREDEDPDWREVRRVALELASRAKDLKVAIYLLRAELALEGFPGLRDGLALIAGYLSRYWGSVHPQLDPEDDNDPSARVNTVVALCHIETVLRAIRLTPLTQSRQFGRVNYRQFAIAHGLIPMPTGKDQEERLPDSSQIEGAFADTAQEYLEELQRALGEAGEQATAISGAFDAALGYGYGPNLEALTNLLREIKAVIDRQVAVRGGADVPPIETGQAAGPSAATGGGGSVAVGSGVIRGRADVTLLIDKICRYYAENEPSSPVPLILARVKRLVVMDFLEILKDLTPDGVDQFKTISGIKDAEEDE
jgi:type VI secretion system protein ImpA